MPKSHDQRKGQWLYNQIRLNPEFECRSELDCRQEVADELWNMSNDDFDKIMKEYES